MEVYIEYDDTGNICGTIYSNGGVIRSEFNTLLHSGGEVCEDTQYIEISDCKLSQKQDYTLDQLPIPCKITIEGVEYNVTDQPELTFNVDGIYKISIDAGVEYLKKEFEIDYKS